MRGVHNATSDRILGFPDVSRLHAAELPQNGEQFEIMFNKTKYAPLPAKMQAIIANAVEAASADMSWKAINRYSQDYIELQTKDKVRFYKTPDSVLQRQLEIFDQVNGKSRQRTRCGRRSAIAEKVRRSARCAGPRHHRRPSQGI